MLASSFLKPNTAITVNSASENYNAISTGTNNFTLDYSLGSCFYLTTWNNIEFKFYG
jgi:hypothetical protein